MNKPTVTDANNMRVVTVRLERAILLAVQNKTTKAASGLDYHGAFLSADEARKVASELTRYADEADAVLVATPMEREIILNHFRDHGKFLKIEEVRAGAE